MELFNDRHYQPRPAFLMPDRPPLADPDRITEPVCLTHPPARTRAVRSVAQAGEALAIISAMVAVGFIYTAF
jgi:hypothetical protein